MGEGRARLAFRPEVQGLRALAVAFVVVYHFWPDALPGGFIGVDVFFVVSGFLITGQLVRELDGTGSISLARFWARRIRRLLPAASVVLAVSLVTMLAIVPRSLWQQTVVEIGASALYVENWVLAVGAVDYLGADSTPTLAQHFWSLSVEEQFYLAWPLLLLLAALWARRSPRMLLALLSSVFVFSLAYSVSQADTPAGYFNTGTRAWEFAAGALLALAPGALAWLGRHPVVGAAGSWAGVVLVVVAAALFNGSTPFPGAAALLPVAGTVLVIAAGTIGRSAGRAAGLAPVQALGDISYSLYLWHWPVILVLPYLAGTADAAARPIGLAIAVGLAWLTKRFVEDPVRRSPVMLARPGRSYLVAASTISVIAMIATMTWGSVQSGAAAAARDSVEQYESNPCYGAAAMAEAARCELPFAVGNIDTAFSGQDKGALADPCNSLGTTVTRCEFGDTEHPELTVAVVGNSHAGALVAGLDAYGKNHGWRIVLMRKTFCLGVSTLPFAQPAGRDCTEWTRNVLKQLQGPDIDAVVVATHRNAMYYLADSGTPASELAALEPHIAANLAALVAAGKSVLVVGDTPGTRPEPAPECVYLHRFDYDPCATPLPIDGLDDGNVVSRASRSVPGVGYLSLLPYVCDSSACHTVIGGTVVYFDDNHLSASFSRSLAPHLGGALEAQLRGP